MKDIKLVFVLCQSDAHSHRPEWYRRMLQSLLSPPGMSASLTASSPRDEGTKGLINCILMCLFVFRFDGFVLVNFFHLWKLIIHCPGSEEDDDECDGDKKITFICQVVCMSCISLSP